MLDILKAMSMLRSPDVTINLETFHVELVKFLQFMENCPRPKFENDVDDAFKEAARKYIDFLKSFGIDLEEVVNQNHPQD